ncbi:MAG: hypothetical protein K5930_13715 [Treponemataceae bacterium]|nr:hypothetical protein [Treponemataceae bacterium]
MARDKKKIIGFVFLLFVSLILMGFYSVLFRSQKDISEAELRTLQKIPFFSFDKFMDASFQSEMDQAVSDQFLFSGEIKQLVKDWDNSLVSYTNRIFRPLAVRPSPVTDLQEAAVGEDSAVGEGAASGAPVNAAPVNAAEDSAAAGGKPAETGQTIVAAEAAAVSEVTGAVSAAISDTASSVATASASYGAASEAAAISEAATTGDTASPPSSPAASMSAVSAQPPLKQKYDYIYTEVVSKYLYKLDESGYIIQKASDPDTYDFDLYSKEMLDRVTYPKYLYFINSSMSFDFRDPQKYDPFSVIKENFSMDAYAQLEFNNFEEYKKLFYQTDHHWNYRGSYEGYKQCMRMLEGDDVELLQPKATHTYPTIYNGSLARDNAIKCSTELFTVYEFDIPPYKTYIDDEEAVYGYRYLYESDEDFPHNTYSNHYGMYYGDDHAKVVYVFDNPDAQSLLILATSYSNAVNELIASHYKETHILDFRHYRKKYGEAIDAQSYMEENKLDKLLIIGDISSLGHKVR